MKQDSRALIAELVGTFFFVTLGAGVIVTDYFTGGKTIGLLGIAVCHGLALSLAVTATMRVSGGHLNPAVTVAMWSLGKVNPPTAVAYILMQLIGSVLAAAVLLTIFDRSVWDPVHLGTPGLGAGVHQSMGMWIEIVATFFLLFAIMGTAVYAKSPIQIGGFGVGLTIFADILVVGPLTGASMNPARSFGPALMSGFMRDHWIYWVGPIIGALIAANVYYRFIADPDER